jgi:hypothetical protein
VRVQLHLKASGQEHWETLPREFGRLPVVGEYVAPDDRASWFRVALVVHAPTSDQYGAEVYALAGGDTQRLVAELRP